MIARLTFEERLANCREQYERDQLASARMLRDAEAEIDRLRTVLLEARRETAQLKAELAAVAEPDGDDTDTVGHG